MNSYTTKKFFTFVLIFSLLFSLLAPGASPAVRAAEETDPEVAAVIALLKQIDSLQEMQDKRKTITVKTDNIDDAANGEAHKAAQQQYQDYIDDMFAKRAEAKEAYEALTEEQQAQVAADPEAAAGLAKLTPYEELDTVFPLTNDYPLSLTPADDEYTYEALRVYELAQNINSNRDFPFSFALADVSGDATSWTPSGLYEYGESNYILTYCCDTRVTVDRHHHYKRINLEDADYYSTNDARKIRAIVQVSYPFVSMDEMKRLLIAGGYPEDYANALTRSDIVAAVQFAIWTYANRSTPLKPGEYDKLTTYGGTGEIIDYPYASRRLIISMHDYRNELWCWYNTGFDYAARNITYHEDIAARVNALTQYLTSLPGVDAEEEQIVISDVRIARSAPVEGSEDTYSLDLKVFLNHGTANGDVSIYITSSADEEGSSNITSSETIRVTNASEYDITITAKYGDTVNVIVNGTQMLPKGVYFYEPKRGEGENESQSFVGVGEGETRVYTRDSFRFVKESDIGLRIYKTEKGTNYPISDISFNVYAAVPEEGETLSGIPTEAEIAKYATAANLAGTMTTDSTGYAFLDLQPGTYLVMEVLNPDQVKATADPFYITLPSPDGTYHSGSITIVYGDVITVYVENTPKDEPGTVSVEPEVTKAFSDWGKADAFRFRLAAVTENAPMPENTVATATEANPTAVFDRIVFEKEGIYEYTITEINDGADGVSYDTTAHSVVVTVTKETSLNNEGLEVIEYAAEIKYDGADSLTVTNTFAPAEAAPEVTKVLSGRDWAEGESFLFTLAAVTENAPMPEKTEGSATKAAPTVSFGTIRFEKAGVYEYTITETGGSTEGLAFDTAAHAVVITVTKNATTNALTAEIKYDGADSLTVTNTFAPAEAAPEVTKVLSGRDWAEGESFLFTLAAVTENAPMPEKTEGSATKEEPTVSFGTISFEKAGTYEYTITEAGGSTDGLAFDTAAHKVVITVTKDEKTNALTAEVKYDGADSLTVTNTFAPAEAAPEVTKVLSGRDWAEGESFLFTLAAVTENAPMPEKTEGSATKAAPTVSFGTITFTKAGTYEYTITETGGSTDGLAFDTAAHKVVITVTKDEKTNALTAGIKYDGADSLTVTNTFTPAEAAPEVTKVLSGRDWAEGESFLFTLAAVTENAPMPEKTEGSATKAAPTVSFGTITFTKAGSYEYTITETGGSTDGLTFDTAAHKVVITVTKDEKTNALTAGIKYDGADSLTVTNTFTPAEAAPEVTKVLIGRDWKDSDAFLFTLAAVSENAPLPEQTKVIATKAEPTVSFGTIRFEKAGTYEYTVTEAESGIAGVSCDTTPHRVMITVTKDEKTNVLSAEISYGSGNTLIIENVYEAKPVSVAFWGSKTIEGQPEDSLTFTFLLKETTAGSEYQDSVTVLGKGTAAFKAISFDKAGVYTFEIREEAGSAKGWTYDATVYKVTVTVTDNGMGQLTALTEGLSDNTAVFANTYVPETTPEETTPAETTPAETTTAAETTPAETPPDAPPTGEGNETLRWGIIGGSALVCGILLVVFRRFFTKKDPEGSGEE